MAKIYTIAFKNDEQAVYEIVQPERAWSDKKEASRALRAMGGGKHGDNALVLYSYYLDEDKPAEAQEEKEFYVTLVSWGVDYEDARNKLLARSEGH